MNKQTKPFLKRAKISLKEKKTIIQISFSFLSFSSFKVKTFLLILDHIRSIRKERKKKFEWLLLPLIMKVLHLNAFKKQSCLFIQCLYIYFIWVKQFKPWRQIPQSNILNHSVTVTVIFKCEKNKLYILFTDIVSLRKCSICQGRELLQYYSMRNFLYSF